MWDYIVIGSGFCGSVIAREIADQLDKKVLVLEKRPHIAGNMYDAKDKNGIMIQHYGPHTFVTDKKELLDYLCRFADWEEYIIKARVEIDGELMPIPFNFRSIELFYDGKKAALLIDKLKCAFPGQERIPVYMLTESSDGMIREYGELLYEKDYIPYTSKHWGIPPEKIDKSVIARVKIALSYDDNYMQQKYQYMPKTSFTDVFSSMLNHKNITVKTNTDALDFLDINVDSHTIHFDGVEKPIIFTGPIDELFGGLYGMLPYRSLDIKVRTVEQDYAQFVPLLAYPQAEGYIRSCEYKYLYRQEIPGISSVSYEYPLLYDPKAEKGNIPYYPIINDTNRERYMKYKSLADRFRNLYVCGRLGDYRYYNMDAAIERALEIFRQIKEDA